MKLRTYCLACRNHANNIGSKTVTMTIKWSGKQNSIKKGDIIKQTVNIMFSV